MQTLSENVQVLTPLRPLLDTRDAVLKSIYRTMLPLLTYIREATGYRAFLDEVYEASPGVTVLFVHLNNDTGSRQGVLTIPTFHIDASDPTTVRNFVRAHFIILPKEGFDANNSPTEE